MTHKLCQKANFENRVAAIQIGILHGLLNNLSYLYYLGHDAKREVMSFYVLKKIKKMQVAGLNIWLILPNLFCKSSIRTPVHICYTCYRE